DDGRSAMRAVEADDVPISEMLERELVGWDEPETAIASPAVQHLAGPAFEDGFDGEQFSPETEATAMEAGFDAAEFEAAETVADVEIPAEAVAPAATDENIDRHAGAVDTAPDASLEDELNALLS